MPQERRKESTTGHYQNGCLHVKDRTEANSGRNEMCECLQQTHVFFPTVSNSPLVTQTHPYTSRLSLFFFCLFEVSATRNDTRLHQSPSNHRHVISTSTLFLFFQHLDDVFSCMLYRYSITTERSPLCFEINSSRSVSDFSPPIPIALSCSSSAAYGC